MPDFESSIHITLYEFLPPSDGGIAQAALETASELHRRGYKAGLCGFKDLLRSPLYENCGMDLWPLPRKGWKRFKDLYLLISFVKMRLKYGTRVILYSQTWKTGRLAVIVCRFFGWRVVLFAHGNEVVRQIGSHKEKLMVKTFKNADAVFANSTYVCERMKQIGIENGILNRLGVNPSRFTQLQADECKKKFGWEGRKVLLTAARVVPRKGQDTLIRALPGLLPEFNNLLYVIAGSGEESELQRLRNLAGELGVSDQVCFTGFVDEKDKNALFCACDVYVMVSRAMNSNKDIEGFGITFLEANCCARPVIGSYSGGIRDAVEDGVSGYLIEPDDLETLSGHLFYLLQNENVRYELGMQARKRVLEYFTWEKYVDRMINALETAWV